jgi:uncharacterized protein YjbJ (UPF0337 family)
MSERENDNMHRDRIAGYWRQLRGIVQQRWSRLTANYAGVVAGKRQQTLGQIQETYGVTTDLREKQLAAWHARQHKSDPIHK